MIDRIQKRLLRRVGMTTTEALLICNLAPLHTRRDIAMLGVIHRAMIGEGPDQFRDIFTLTPGSVQGRTTRVTARTNRIRVVTEVSHMAQDYILHSALGLTRIYNRLPDAIVGANSVAHFQTMLQHMLKEAAQQDFPCWEFLLSPRVKMSLHPLTKWTRLNC